MTNETPSPICPECSAGELRLVDDANGVECDNCARWWATPPAPAMAARPGTDLARAGR